LTLRGEKNERFRCSTSPKVGRTDEEVQGADKGEGPAKGPRVTKQEEENSFEFFRIRSRLSNLGLGNDLTPSKESPEI